MKVFYEVNENLIPDLSLMLNEIAENFPPEIQKAFKNYLESNEKTKWL